jgi:hypothetical protein
MRGAAGATRNGKGIPPLQPKGGAPTKAKSRSLTPIRNKRGWVQDDSVAEIAGRDARGADSETGGAPWATNRKASGLPTHIVGRPELQGSRNAEPRALKRWKNAERVDAKRGWPIGRLTEFAGAEHDAGPFVSYRAAVLPDPCCGGRGRPGRFPFSFAIFYGCGCNAALGTLLIVHGFSPFGWGKRLKLLGRRHMRCSGGRRGTILLRACAAARALLSARDSSCGSQASRRLPGIREPALLW